MTQFLDNILRKRLRVGVKLCFILEKQRDHSLSSPNPSRYKRVQGEWIRYGPLKKHALVLHKGQRGKQSKFMPLSKSNPRETQELFVRWQASRGQPWTFIWRTILSLAITPNICRPSYAPRPWVPGQGWGTFWLLHRLLYLESPWAGRKAERVDPRMLSLARPHYSPKLSQAEQSTMHGDMWMTMNGDMRSDWVTERCQEHPNPRQPGHPQRQDQIPLRSLFPIMKSEEVGINIPTLKELRD